MSVRRRSILLCFYGLVVAHGAIAQENSSPVVEQSSAAAATVASRDSVDPALGRTLPMLHCQDVAGTSHSFSQWSDRPVLVMVILGTECPLVRLYLPRLAELVERYGSRGVTLVGVDANRQDTPAEIAELIREFAIPFPVLIDPENRLADALGATRTPEVFVFDAQRVVRYHGRIDDQFAAGLQRREATRHDLADAIDALLADREVASPSTPLSGCLIGRVRKAAHAEAAAGQLPESTPTWSRDISRIFQQHCQECHRPGQIGPFPLETYADIAGWEDMIAEVVGQRRMPPWHANPAYGKFVSDLQLPDTARDSILSWLHAGAPEGDPAELPPPRQFSDDWTIDSPHNVYAMAAKPFAVPASGTLGYEYFVVDPEYSEAKWIEAIECRPGNRSVVHHINVFLLPPEVGEPFQRDQLTNNLLWAWAPGVRALELPPGMARRVTAGTKFVFQMHYTTVGRPQTDLSRMAVRYANSESVRQEVEIALAVNNAFVLPPRADNTRVVAWYEFTRPGLLFAMHPHMHLRGKSFRFEAVYPDGSAEVLLDIPRFDFGWQYEYRLAEPKQIPAGTRICCLAHFDNSAANLLNPDPSATVRWGDQTWEEMMIGYLHVAWPAKSESAPGPAASDAQERSAFRARVSDQSDAWPIWPDPWTLTAGLLALLIAVTTFASPSVGRLRRLRAAS
jgi:thiol-disulfide isomerase/thioredoxin